MIQGIKDYAKCVYANKFTLVGALGMISSGILLSFVEMSPEKFNNFINYVVSPSFVLLCTTAAGAETFIAYRRIKNHIEKYTVLDEKIIDAFSKSYCTRAGLKLAVREIGLENLVN